MLSLGTFVGGGFSGEFTERENNYARSAQLFPNKALGPFANREGNKDTNLFLVISHVH